MEVRNHNTTHHQCSPPPRLDDLQKSHGAIKEDSFASLPMLLRHSNDNEIDKEEHSNRTFITRLMDNSISAPSLIFDPEESLSGHEDAFHFAFEVVRQVEGPSYDAKDLRCSAASHSPTVKGSNSKKKKDEQIDSTCIHSSFRHWCGDIVNHVIVHYFIITLVCINALLMGIATADFVEDNPHVRQAFEKTDMVFLIIFTVELSMQLIYHGKRFCHDGCLVFHFLIVGLSWSFDSVQVVRTFRIFRTLRLVGRLKSLRNVIAVLTRVGPSIGAVMFLLLLVLYIFAVRCTELFWETPLDNDYFNRFDNSLFTLLEMMTLEWADTARQVIEYHSWAWMVFTPFLVITSFILFSLVIAVVCDAVTQTESASLQDEKAVEQHPQQDQLRVSALRTQVKVLTRNQAFVTRALREAWRELEALRTEGADRNIPTHS